MLSYHNLVVSNVQAERSDLIGYRVASGAKAEITPDAINREISESRSGRSFVSRLAALLAVSVVLMLASVHGANAQGRPGLVADADGIEPPDIGTAYSRAPSTGVTAAELDMSPQMAALLLDADGMEPPDCGFAYALPVRSVVAAAERAPTGAHSSLPADVDGIEPPDMGVAFDTGKAFVAFVKRQQEIQALEIAADADGIEPPDMGIAYDTSAAYRAYAERQQRGNRIAGRVGGRN